MIKQKAGRIAFALMILGSVLIGRVVQAQHEQPTVKAPPREAGGFDFLVGQWELTVTPKATGLAARIHGTPKLHGTWKGWHALDGWGVEDELRVLDASGNTVVYTHFVRMYDAATKEWAIASADVTKQQLVLTSAVWQGADVVSVLPVRQPDGTTRLTRTRLGSITANSFRYQQDRSDDGGKTWDEGHLVIVAKRVAPTAAR